MNKYIITAMLAFAFLVSGGMVAHASTTFNGDPQDFSTIRVSNFTEHPNSTTDWHSTVTATPGQVVSVAVYYHNTGSENATNTIVKILGG